jgi:hypothetical protein
MSIQDILRNPFPSDRIEWRLAMCGSGAKGIWARCLAYIDNRAAMERLDEAFGPNWSHHEQFTTIGGAAVCTVTISVDGVEGYPARSVTGSAAVEANGDIDQFKSAASGAMKRAVVNLGVGRYLYDLPEAWAVIGEDGAYSGKTKDGQWFKWNPPALPAWALPSGDTGSNVSPASTLENHREESRPAKAQEFKPDATRFKANPEAPKIAEAIPHADGFDPWAVPIHFGKNKGKALRDLPENTLRWYLNEWKPQPFKGRVSETDTSLRAALDMISGNASVPERIPQPISHEGDEVPF